MKPKTAKEVLDIIRDFIQDGARKSGEGLSLWLILSALRGPDYIDNTCKSRAKASTTEVIRHVALGDITCKCVGSLSAKDTKTKAKLRKEFANSHDHFWVHAKLAFEALGLKWKDKN